RIYSPSPLATRAPLQTKPPRRHQQGQERRLLWCLTVGKSRAADRQSAVAVAEREGSRLPTPDCRLPNYPAACCAAPRPPSPPAPLTPPPHPPRHPPAATSRHPPAPGLGAGGPPPQPPPRAEPHLAGVDGTLDRRVLERRPVSVAHVLQELRHRLETLAHLAH